MIDHPARAVLPPGLRLSGDLSLLSVPRRAVLVSRTARRITPGTAWVRATVEAVGRSARNDEVLVTGAGRDPYDVALLACRRAGGAAIVVLECDTESLAEWRGLEGMVPERRLLVWPDEALPEGRSQRASRMALRDRWIGQIADRAWEILVRRNGNMAALRDSLRARGCSVEHVELPAEPAVDGDPSRNQAATAGPREETWEDLVHYTREPDGAWPGEPRADYIGWLVSGDGNSRRDAPDALRRILTQGIIQASPRLMPRRQRMVCFTARAPWEMSELFRWRAGLARWTFRPYGVAVRRHDLEALGARPVQYLPESELRALSESDREFGQKHDPPRTDWSAEREWRLRGDLRLDGLPRESLRIVVPTRAEAELFDTEFGLPTMATFGRRL